MQQARERRQPLRINTEWRIEMNDMCDCPFTPPVLEAHKLIEMMVSANVCAAETLEKAKHADLPRMTRRLTSACAPCQIFCAR